MLSLFAVGVASSASRSAARMCTKAGKAGAIKFDLKFSANWLAGSTVKPHESGLNPDLPQ